MLRQPGPNKKTPDVKVEGPYVTVTFTGGLMSYRYECLPDTVDPRGPQGQDEHLRKGQTK